MRAILRLWSPSRRSQSPFPDAVLGVPDWSKTPWVSALDPPTWDCRCGPPEPVMQYPESDLGLHAC